MVNCKKGKEKKRIKLDEKGGLATYSFVVFVGSSKVGSTGIRLLGWASGGEAG